MTYKQIEASREVRLWIRDIVVPATVVALTTMANPQARQAIASIARNVKESITEKVKKIKEKK